MTSDRAALLAMGKVVLNLGRRLIHIETAVMTIQVRSGEEYAQEFKALKAEITQYRNEFDERMDAFLKALDQ